MTAEEFKKAMHIGNRYTCGFCGKEVEDKPTLTLCLCKGFSGYDIADICESCTEKIRVKAVYSDGES
jgi:DNA-directed RNA polymerase subunit RPC12/RpoP